MNTLALQREMVRYLLSERLATPASSALPLTSRIAGDALPRLGVYHNAYRMQLLACLHDTYEKTWRWLGDAAFDDAALRHIDTHPPGSWTLADYGAGFDATLSGRFPDDPELPELAWLDWTLRRSFDGGDVITASSAELAATDWSKAILRLTPSLRMRSVATNVASLWSAIAAAKQTPQAARLDTALALRVWRQELTPRFRSIEPLEYRLLTLAQQGETFATLCSVVSAGAQPGEDTVQIVGRYLAAWIADGLVIGTA